MATIPDGTISVLVDQWFDRATAQIQPDILRPLYEAREDLKIALTEGLAPATSEE